MNVLLDTHTLLWLVSAPGDVDASALAVVSNSNTRVWVTAASVWEIAVKTRLGRLDGEALLSAWSDIVADMSVTEFPIESSDANLAGRLPWEHKDPFDRVIVAQALRRNLTIATRDTKILGAGITATLIRDHFAPRVPACRFSATAARRSPAAAPIGAGTPKSLPQCRSRRRNGRR